VRCLCQLILIGVCGVTVTANRKLPFWTHARRVPSTVMGCSIPRDLDRPPHRPSCLGDRGLNYISCMAWWICQTCKKPCDGSGYVRVHNANADLGPVGGYPIKPSPDRNPRHETDAWLVGSDPDVATRQELAESQTAEAIWLIDRPINIGFDVRHAECFETEGGYNIPCPGSFANWVSWINHLQEKNWMGHLDTVRMLNFWWDHKGLPWPGSTNGPGMS